VSPLDGTAFSFRASLPIWTLLNHAGHRRVLVGSDFGESCLAYGLATGCREEPCTVGFIWRAYESGNSCADMERRPFIPRACSRLSALYIGKRRINDGLPNCEAEPQRRVTREKRIFILIAGLELLCIGSLMAIEEQFQQHIRYSKHSHNYASLNQCQGGVTS